MPSLSSNSVTWQSSYSSVPIRTKEYTRLDAQHILTRSVMPGGKLICAPVSIQSSSEFHILDSACNNGTWIFNLISDQIPSGTKVHFLGTDIDKNHFPSPDAEPMRELGENFSVEFEVQDISHPWPSDLHGKFDLVHQRYALQYMGEDEVTNIKTVKGLLGLARSGTGWVQLVEANALDWAADCEVECVQRARKMTEGFLAKMNINPNADRGLKRWLEAAGGSEVEWRTLVWVVGGESEMGRMARRNLVEFLGTQAKVCQAKG